MNAASQRRRYEPAVPHRWVLLLATLFASAAGAHHSFAMFDTTKKITVTGVVRDYQWTNPHVFVQLVVADAQGQAQEWSIEGASPNMLYRAGWSKSTFSIGERLTIVINPLRDGGNGGYFVSCQLPDGTTLGTNDLRPPG